MSEFSETCHLEAGSQQAGIELMRAAEARGFVLPPDNGWVTIVPEDGQPVAPIARFSEGAFLHLLTASDRGWMFELFSDGVPASRYLCRWDGGLVIDDRLLDVAPLIELAVRRGVDPMSARRALERILLPSEAEILGIADAEDPATAFAQLIGLSFGGSSRGEVTLAAVCLETTGIARVD
jgi:hypothetical protein